MESGRGKGRGRERHPLPPSLPRPPPAPAHTHPIVCGPPSAGIRPARCGHTGGASGALPLGADARRPGGRAPDALPAGLLGSACSAAPSAGARPAVSQPARIARARWGQAPASLVREDGRRHLYTPPPPPPRSRARTHTHTVVLVTSCACDETAIKCSQQRTYRCKANKQHHGKLCGATWPLRNAPWAARSVQ